MSGSGSETSSPAVDLRRLGDVGKCPVCGSAVDPEAYYCPTCSNYFCFHCRARLLPADTQVQCVNQDCTYYAKLVCEACSSRQEKEELPAVYAEPEDGYWPGWLVLVLVFAAVIWYFSYFWVAALVAIVGYLLGGYLLQWMGINVFGRERKVEYQRKSSFHNCIRCGQPVKELQGAG